MGVLRCLLLLREKTITTVHRVSVEVVDSAAAFAAAGDDDGDVGSSDRFAPLGPEEEVKAVFTRDFVSREISLKSERSKPGMSTEVK